jgi:hypothetical protein
MPNQILTHTQDSKLLPNTRSFEISADEMLDCFQDVTDYIRDWNMPFVRICNKPFLFHDQDANTRSYSLLELSPPWARNYQCAARQTYCKYCVCYDEEWNVCSVNTYTCMPATRYLDLNASYNTWFEPTCDLHPATKKYVDDATAPLSCKLDKVTDTNTYWRVYGISTAWEQVTVCISPGLVNNTLVRRSWNQIIVPNEPTLSCHATSKCYVDSNFLPQSEVKKTCVLTQTQFCNCTNKECCTLYLIYQ